MSSVTHVLLVILPRNFDFVSRRQCSLIYGFGSFNKSKSGMECRVTAGVGWNQLRLLVHFSLCECFVLTGGGDVQKDRRGLLCVLTAGFYK